MKKMKLISFLVAVLALLAVFPASASAAGNNRDIQIRADCIIPQVSIEVTVPASTTAYLNPKSISVNTAGKVQNGQIISDPAYIENKSAVPVSVSASITGAVNRRSTLELRESTTVGADLTTKEAFIYFEMQAVNDPAADDWDINYNANKHIIVYEGTESKENFVTLAAGTQAKRYGAFHLTGDCVADPVDDPWVSRDGIKATIVFTFKPLPLS